MSHFGVSVAKKLIINFFGLQKSQGIRKIARKVIAFLAILMKTEKFKNLFNLILQNV